MNHKKSNLNISKKHLKSSNKNNFNKSSKFKKNSNISKINFYNHNANNFQYFNTNNNIYNSIDFALFKTNSTKEGIGIKMNLPYKDSIKSSMISNKNDYDSKSNNKKYTLKMSNSNKFLSLNSINSINSNSAKYIYNTSRKKSHNIRLNLNNNEIINKNFPTENNRKINKRKNDLYYTEKQKEKNYKINKLKKDLIISEMILNELKNKEDKSDFFNDKNFESINYEFNNNNSNNMITKINFDKNKKSLTLNFNNSNFNNKKGIPLINIGSLLTFNYINNNNISYFNNYQKSLSPEKNFIHTNNYFYSLTNNNYNYSNKSLSSKKSDNNKNKIIFIKKSGPFCEKNKRPENSLKIFVEKCNDLKQRTKTLLSKYIKLSEVFIEINKKNIEL